MGSAAGEYIPKARLGGAEDVRTCGCGRLENSAHLGQNKALGENRPTISGFECFVGLQVILS